MFILIFVNTHHITQFKSYFDHKVWRYHSLCIFDFVVCFIEQPITAGILTVISVCIPGPYPRSVPGLYSVTNKSSIVVQVSASLHNNTILVKSQKMMVNKLNGFVTLYDIQNTIATNGVV